MIASADLLADLAIMRQAYETLHPGLYRYNTAEELQVRWAGLEKEFGRDRTLGETYLLMSQFLATIKCGHTYCNFFNQPKPIAEALLKHDQRLPVLFRWIDRRMIVTESFCTDPRVVRGTEIMKINGVATATLLERMLAIARADGGNDAKRVRYLDVTASSRFEAFDIYLPLLLGDQLGLGNEFALSIQPPGTSAPIDIREKGVTYSQRLQQVQVRHAEPSKEDPAWTWTTYEGAALLTMPTWALYNSTWDWKEWLDGKLNELAASDAKALIIDLRGNEGGQDCGDPIISRLIDADLGVNPAERYTRFTKVPADLNPYLDTWDDSFRDVSALVEPASRPALVSGGEPYFRAKAAANAEDGSLIRAVKPRFAGKVYVLVDAACSSATFQFATLVQRHRLGTLVGEPTGGNQRGINGAYFFFLRLPRTGIEMDVPLVGLFPGGDDAPDAGLTPDVLVKVTAADIAGNRDAALHAVKQLMMK